MSSYAASCCTCSRKVSCASETSASWPTASVPPPCHFAFICSAQHRKPSRRSHPQVSFGSAPNAVDQCWSSKGLRLLKSSVVLHLAAEQISSSRFSTRSVCGHLAYLPSPAHAVLSSALRRTASAHLDAL